MAANTYCENCGVKGRVEDGLCHKCYDEEVGNRRLDELDVLEEIRHE